MEYHLKNITNLFKNLYMEQKNELNIDDITSGYDADIELEDEVFIDNENNIFYNFKKYIKTKIIKNLNVKKINN